MSDTIHVLAIAGSLRRGSYNRATLRAARELAPEGMEIEIFARLGEIPPFNQDLEDDPPEVVADLKEQIRAADAVVFATPEYNFSIPGVLKNAMDWGSRPFGDSAWEGKPAAIMSASVSLLGGVRAQNHLRQSMVYLDMYPVNAPEVLIAAAEERFDSAGVLTDETSRKLIRELLENLATWTQRLKSGERSLAGVR